MEHQGWRQKGACASLDEATADKLFFLGRGGSPKAAKALCDTCPVKRQCREYAIYYREYGIWGGTTDEEREDLRAILLANIRNRWIAAGVYIETRTYDYGTVNPLVQLEQEWEAPIPDSEPVQWLSAIPEQNRALLTESGNTRESVPA